MTVGIDTIIIIHILRIMLIHDIEDLSLVVFIVVVAIVISRANLLVSEMLG